MRLPRHPLLFAALMFAVLPSAAFAAPLMVVNVGAPAINCVFSPTCTVTVTDTIGAFPTAPGYAGTPRLQSRTYVGGPGTPGAGLTAYVYRVDFTAATAVADINCVQWLKVDFGPVAHLPYRPGVIGEVFVVTSGGLGSIGVASANRVGNIVTFNFTSPVCPENAQAPGQTSFFFGLAAKGSPKPSMAKAQLTFGGGVVNVADRVPGH